MSKALLFPEWGLGYAWSSPYLEIREGETVSWNWKSPKMNDARLYSIKEADSNYQVKAGGIQSTTGKGTSNGKYTSTLVSSQRPVCKRSDFPHSHPQPRLYPGLHSRYLQVIAEKCESPPYSEHRSA